MGDTLRAITAQHPQDLNTPDDRAARAKQGRDGARAPRSQAPGSRQWALHCPPPSSSIALAGIVGCSTGGMTDEVRETNSSGAADRIPDMVTPAHTQGP
jgi:hypothetical protein